MKSKHVMLLGCGDLGCSLGLRLKDDRWRVTAVRRNVTALPPEFDAVGLDYTDPENVDQLADIDCDVAVMTPTPMGRDASGYRRGYLLAAEQLLRAWEGGPARELVFVSSTRVYGDHDGGWVDENTEPAPRDEPGEIILAAEKLLLESRHKVCVVRFSGIYGRTPSFLLRRLQQGKLSAPNPARYSNRIHREDCIGSLYFLLHRPVRDSLYLASDSAPCLQRDLEEWLLERLGQKAREEIPVAGANRRCSNRRIVEQGYRFRYPDFHSGYSAMISSTSMPTPFGSAAT